MCIRFGKPAEGKQNQQLILQKLEKALVLEFRASQALFALTKSERRLLVNRDYGGLVRLIEQKEACLTELERIVDHRSTVVHDLRRLSPSETRWLPFDEFITRIEPTTAHRFIQLENGVQTLLEQLKSLIEGNRALARSVVECAQNAPEFVAQIYRDPDRSFSSNSLPQLVPSNSVP